VIYIRLDNYYQTGRKIMKKKVIGIFVCMLLIGSVNIALADWSEGDGYKMHFPQLPDPYGWDVDFHDWMLGDDWECTETGPVSDIHFWISWIDDIVMDIPWVKVSIYSNDPGPPSKPLELLWSYTFNEGQFIIAGPWNGDQGWYWPYGEFIENNHIHYWQINIPEIEEPFIQEAGTIYWLVIQMPYYDPPFAVGWKTSVNHFMDAAVWGGPGDWQPIHDPITGDIIDFAFVITTEEEPPPECCLEIVTMSGGILSSPSSLNVQAVIKNTGDGECKDIRWDFTFSGGLILYGPKGDLIPSLLPGATATVNSNIVIGLAIPGIFPGNVTIKADCPDNVCPPATMTKGIFLLILLLNTF
jgi:hypothetical protein